MDQKSRKIDQKSVMLRNPIIVLYFLNYISYLFRDFKCLLHL